MCVHTLESALFKLYEGLSWMILGHFSGCMQQLLCRTRPAGHWQPGTQGLKQWLSITPSGTLTLKQVTGHGGPHSSNTKPLSTGQPTAVENSNRGRKQLKTHNSVTMMASRVRLCRPFVIGRGVWKNCLIIWDGSFASGCFVLQVTFEIGIKFSAWLIYYKCSHVQFGHFSMQFRVTVTNITPTLLKVGLFCACWNS